MPPTSTTTTTLAVRLPDALLHQDARSLLSLADLGLGWASNPQGGMKAWVEDFTGGNCGGPDLAARSRGNSGVNSIGFQQASDVGPFSDETVVVYPTVEAAKFAYRDSTFSSLQCGQWTDSDGNGDTISELPPLHIGDESSATRRTEVAASKYCNHGQVDYYDDVVYVRLASQLLIFSLATQVSGNSCPGPSPLAPDDKVLYDLARKGVVKYRSQLVNFTKKHYGTSH